MKNYFLILFMLFFQMTSFSIPTYTHSSGSSSSSEGFGWVDAAVGIAATAPVSVPALTLFAVGYGIKRGCEAVANKIIGTD